MNQPEEELRNVQADYEFVSQAHREVVQGTRAVRDNVAWFLMHNPESGQDPLAFLGRVCQKLRELDPEYPNDTATPNQDRLWEDE